MFDPLFNAAAPNVGLCSSDRRSSGNEGTGHPSASRAANLSASVSDDRACSSRLRELASASIVIAERLSSIRLLKETMKMSDHRILAGMILAGALTASPVAQAQQAVPVPSTPAASPAQDEASMGCPALGVEMGRAAQQIAAAQLPAATTATATALSPLEEAGRAYQAQQNAQQLANLQVLAARGGVNRGAATAAIGSVAALQQVAANGGNVQDAAGSVAGDMVGNQLAKNIPGGKLIGGMMGGLFKKKKPVTVAAVAAMPASSAAQARLTYLGALYQAKGCK